VARLTCWSQIASRSVGREDRGGGCFSDEAGGEDGRKSGPGAFCWGWAREKSRSGFLPSYRSRFSKPSMHPAAVAGILCLMRLRRLDFSPRRKSRLARASRLARKLCICALGPDDTTLYRFFAAGSTRTPGRARGWEKKRCVACAAARPQVAPFSCAIDGTGSISTRGPPRYFLRRSEQQNGGKKSAFRPLLENG